MPESGRLPGLAACGRPAQAAWDPVTAPPIPPAELRLWDAAIATLEACDRQAGITDDATVNARAAYEAACGRAEAPR